MDVEPSPDFEENKMEIHHVVNTDAPTDSTTNELEMNLSNGIADSCEDAMDANNVPIIEHHVNSDSVTHYTISELDLSEVTADIREQSMDSYNPPIDHVDNADCMPNSTTNELQQNISNMDSYTMEKVVTTFESCGDDNAEIYEYEPTRTTLQYAPNSYPITANLKRRPLSTTHAGTAGRSSSCTEVENVTHKISRVVDGDGTVKKRWNWKRIFILFLLVAVLSLIVVYFYKRHNDYSDLPPLSPQYKENTNDNDHHVPL